MPEWVTDLMTIAPALGAIVIFCIAMFALGVFVVKRLPLVKKFIHFLDDWAGEEERPGVERRPGVLERMQIIEHEVRTNSGTSLKDAVKRIERAQTEHREEAALQLTEIRDSITTLAQADAQLREDFENTLPKDNT